MLLTYFLYHIFFLKETRGRKRNKAICRQRAVGESLFAETWQEIWKLHVTKKRNWTDEKTKIKMNYYIYSTLNNFKELILVSKSPMIC